MRSPSMLMILLGALFLLAAACGSEGQSCNVADACAARCAAECAPTTVISIACVGNACNCRCGEGSGGAGGAGGSGGGGGGS